MESGPLESSGFLSSLRSLGEGLVSGVQRRLELFSLEVQEEKYRLIQIFLWISGAIFSAVMAITFLSLTLVYLFWESARIAVLVGLTVFYAGTFVTVVVGFRRYLARQPHPFAATLEELKEDRECIRKEN